MSKKKFATKPEPLSPNYPAMQQKLQQAAREAITARGQMIRDLE
jgi:hypothetical protein